MACSSEATEDLAQGDALDGETAFKLYDTYGFPLDLTQDALRQRGIAVDLDGFNAAMERQKAEARANWAGSGEAATEAVWFCRARQGRRHRIPRLRDGESRRHRRRSGQGWRRSSRTQGKARRSASFSTRRHSMANPAARSAIAARSPAISLVIEVTDTQKRGDGVFVHTGRVVEGTLKTGSRSNSRSITRAARGCAPTIPPPISCTRRCARCSARMSHRRLAGRDRIGCGSISRIPSRSRQEELDAGGGDGQRDHPAEQPRDDAPDGGRRCDRGGRDGAVRREIWRRGSRRLDGDGGAGGKGGQALFGRIVRRHACACAPAISAWSGWSAKARSPPAYAASRR